MDEASVALKLEGAGRGRAALETAGAAPGMRIASTCIGVPLEIDCTRRANGGEPDLAGVNERRMTGDD